MKDLDKQKQALNSYRGNPAIAESVLDEVVGKLDRCFTTLNNLPGKAGQSLTENDWLMSIRSRVGIPGGTCEFDLPAYYAWQHRDAGAAPGRPGALGRHAGAAGRIDPHAAQAAARLGHAAEGDGQPRPAAADPAAGPHLPAAAPAPRPGARAGARNQRQPPDGFGAADAPGSAPTGCRPATTARSSNSRSAPEAAPWRSRTQPAVEAAPGALPRLRRRQRLRADQSVPAVLQRALQEHRPGRLGQRGVSGCRRSRPDAE